MSQFIVLLPRLEVSDANALSAWWFIAPPSPTAYIGFAQALALKCLPPELGHEFIGVGVVLHDYRLRAEKVEGTYSWLPHQLRAAALINADDYSSKNKNALSLQPTARCDMTLSLAIVFEEGASVDMDRVDIFLRNARIASGAVAMDSPKPVILEDMRQVKNHIKTGFALHARTDLMTPAEGEDALDALLRATLPTTEQKESTPWLMPATLGFATVTAMQDRVWTRDGHPHAFAEPLVGLVQLKSLKETFIPTWKYQRPSERVFLVGH
jgi:CRISPR-associated protein Csy2